jgi:hypothetical protein
MPKSEVRAIDVNALFRNELVLSRRNFEWPFREPLARCDFVRYSRLSIDMSSGTLYIQELRATMRGRFALLGAGVILLAVGCVATVGTQDTWLDGYGIIAYFLVPLAFVPLSAAFLASPRIGSWRASSQLRSNAAIG